MNFDHLTPEKREELKNDVLKLNKPDEPKLNGFGDEHRQAVQKECREMREFTNNMSEEDKAKYRAMAMRMIYGTDASNVPLDKNGNPIDPMNDYNYIPWVYTIRCRGCDKEFQRKIDSYAPNHPAFFVPKYCSRCDAKITFEEAKEQILKNDLAKVARDRDEYKMQLNAANREIKELKEALEVFKNIIEKNKQNKA
jgi:hypothetical protein